MKVKFENCVIFVRDIEASKKFYIEILKQKVKFDFGKNIVFTSGICLWELTETLEITKTLQGRLNGQDKNNFELYFETDDIEGFYEKLSEKQLKILHNINEEPWGQKTFRFLDYDGHLIEIGESMETFVMKYYNSGMTVEQVSEKTTINKNVIAEIVKNNYKKK